MEQHYHELADPGRRAWDALWMAAGDTIGGFQLPAQTLYTAIDALKALDSVIYDWTEPLAALLHPLALAEKTLNIERVLEP